MSEPAPPETVQAYATLFAGLDQLGPGSAATREAVLGLVRPHLPTAPEIADMGCGKGTASRHLSVLLPASRITALDNHPGFLEALRTDRITALSADMSAPPLPPASLDLVWCENAVYTIGRGTALRAWHPLLRPQGVVGFSDVIWAIADPSDEAAAFWADEHPAMTTPEGVVADLEAAGFTLLHQLTAPLADWQAYYAPLRRRLEALAPTAGGALAEVLEIMRREIAIFDRYGDSYASTWFVAEG